jgi:HPt (histidine-containing phosphotransfer) domain-containing protein
MTQLLRLSRAAFWLAAGAAALGLAAPAAYRTPLLLLVTLTSALAFGAWRAALRAPWRPVLGAVGTPATPAAGAWREIEAELLRRIDAASTFEAALHAAAQLLRNEFGARELAVYEVGEVVDGHVPLRRLVASQPGFRAVPCRVRLDGRPLARAIAGRRPVVLAPAALVLPVGCGGVVVAALELGGLELALGAEDVASLLAAAGSSLERRAADAAAVLQHAQANRIVAGPAAPGIAPQAASREDRGENDDPCHDAPFARANSQDPRHHMLRPHLRPRAPDEDSPAGGSGAAVPASPDVLDPAALQRLAELDPGGANRLLERVLTAFQTSVARLRPQADAARQAGDRDGLRLVAHTLKSSSASIGALHLSELCARIEATIRADGGADLEPDLQALGAALDATLAAIAKRLEPRA